MSNQFIITGFSDELSHDITEQFKGITKLGVSYYEPRLIGEKNVIKLNNEEIADLKALMAKYGIKASSIGSPIGKVNIADFDKHFEEFKRTVEVAKLLDCKYIRMFSFFAKTDEEADAIESEVIEKLKIMVEYAEKEGVVLLHENEKGIYGNIARRCKTLFDHIKSDSFKAVFDFSNFVECNQDTVEAYEMLKEHIEYIHIKDCKKGGGVVPAGEGDGNVKEILTLLNDAGYKGFLSIEPHLTKYELPDSDACGELVMSFADGNSRKYVFAFKALIELIAEI